MAYEAPEGDSAALNFLSVKEDTYTPPSGGAVLQRLGEPGYLPPQGAAVDQRLSLAIDYTPPAGDLVGLEFVPRDGPAPDNQYLFPTGVDALAAGAPSLRKQWEFVSPSGFNQEAYGAPVVYLHSRFVSPLGFGAQGYGTPSVINWFKNIYPGGFVATLYGRPTLYNLRQVVVASGFNAFVAGTARVENWRTIAAPSGYSATAFGVAALAGGVRQVDLAGRGIGAAALGTPRISFAINLIIPVGYAATTYGKPMMGYTRPISPAGYDAALFGAVDVHDNTQRVYATGFDAKGSGTAFLAPRVRTIVQPPMLYDGGFGVAEVYNKTRQIFPYSDTADTWGPYFGNFYYVENRNKTITTYGSQAQAFGLATIENGARSLQVQGLDGELYGQAMVAYRIRRLYPDPLDASFLSNWASVRNAARLIKPLGYDASVLSHYLEVVNTTREITRSGNFESLEFGLAYTDYRIRAVAQRNGIEPPYVPIPAVIFRQRFVLPVGLAAGGVGVPFVEEHFTKIAPRWVYTDQLGDAWVRNRNVSAMPYGYDQSLFGRPEVKNRNTYSPIEGLSFLAFGSPRVSDSTQTVKAVGLAALRTATGHRVQLLQPDLPASQYVSVPGIGIPIPERFGVANVHGNVLYPTGFVGTTYGAPKVVSMGISPQGIFLTNDEQWGIPSLNATQWASPQSIPSPMDNDYSAARFDPYTIWCDRDAPAQAVKNHKNVRFHSIDGLLNQSFEVLTRPFWGTASVTLKNRRLTHRHDSGDNGGDHSRYGGPFVSLRVRTIAPEGIKAIKFGIPQLPSGVDVRVIGYELAEYGYPSLSIYVDPRIPRSVKPAGAVMSAFGTQRVELFIRNIYPSGSVMSVVQKVLRVGPPVRAYPAAFDAALFGQAWASYRIRQVLPAGFDGAEIGYTIGGFNLRMRVYRVDQIPSLQRITPVGFAGAGGGQASIINEARVIRPINCCGGARYGRPVVQAA